MINILTFSELIDTVVTDDNFKTIQPYNADKSYQFIQDILKQKDRNIVIVGDWDVDGIHSAKIIHNDLISFGIPACEIQVYFGDEKSHGIDRKFLQFCQNKHITHIIIVDSSSNELDNLKYLSSMNFKILVIDHHVTNYKYEDYQDICTIINAKLPHNEALFEVSAGFLCWLLSDYWREQLSIPPSKDNEVYGYITLHSDGCKLYDPTIKPLVMHPEVFNDYFPREVAVFTNKYSKLNRDFVSYTYCPRINNICRHNRADLLMRLFFENTSSTELRELRNEIDEMYKETRAELEKLAELSTDYLENLGAVTLVNLEFALNRTNLTRDYLVNSTGLAANMISSKIQKPVVAYLNNQDGMLKCSGRDVTGKIDFKQFLKIYNLEGGGHIYAAGFSIPAVNLHNFKCELRQSIESKPQTKFFMWDCTNANAAAIKDILYRVACYNEVATDKLKPIYLKIKLDNRFSVYQFSKLKRFSFAGLVIIDFKGKARRGTDILVRPDISNINQASIIYEEEQI